MLSNPTEIKALTEWQVRHFEWQRLVRDMEHADLDPPRTQAEHVGKTKALARALYDFVGSDGTTTVGIDRLAYEINMGRTATKERLDRLKKLGLVRIVKSGKGRGKGSIRALTFPEKTVGSSSGKRSEFPSENGRCSDQEVVQEVVALSPAGERGLVVGAAAHPVGGSPPKEIDLTTTEDTTLATNSARVVVEAPLPWTVESAASPSDEPPRLSWLQHAIGSDQYVPSFRVEAFRELIAGWDKVDAAGTSA